MENQIYRLQLTDGVEVEFSVAETNEVEEPYKEIRLLEISFFKDGDEFNEILQEYELDSLIDYLKNCRDYIEDFNANSKPEKE